MGNPNVWRVPSNTVFNCRICNIEITRNSWTQKYCKPCRIQRNKENKLKALRRYYYKNRKVVHHDWQVRLLEGYGEIYCINCKALLRRFDIEKWHKVTLDEQCSERTNVSRKDEK